MAFIVHVQGFVALWQPSLTGLARIPHESSTITAGSISGLPYLVRRQDVLQLRPILLPQACGAKSGACIGYCMIQSQGPYRNNHLQGRHLSKYTNEVGCEPSLLPQLFSLLLPQHTACWKLVRRPGSQSSWHVAHLHHVKRSSQLQKNIPIGKRLRT